MSEPAEQHLDEILTRAAKANPLALVLDFDGTLTPIVSHPSVVVLAESTRALLAQLAGAPRVHVVIVSGRSLDDLQSKVGLERVNYAGNHGLEIAFEGERFEEPEAAALSRELPSILASIQPRLREIPGVALEDKQFSASVHFRNAAPGSENRVREILEEAMKPWADRFVLRDGKMVIEIRPASLWHKGTAALWLLDRLPGVSAIAMGDDITDEDMFASLATSITIRVGAPAKTLAHYHVRTVAQAVRLLAAVRDVRACCAISDQDRRLH